MLTVRVLDDHLIGKRVDRSHRWFVTVGRHDGAGGNLIGLQLVRASLRYLVHECKTTAVRLTKMILQGCAGRLAVSWANVP